MSYLYDFTYTDYWGRFVPFSGDEVLEESLIQLWIIEVVKEISDE